MAGPAVVKERGVFIGGKLYMLRRNYRARQTYEQLSEDIAGSIAYAVAVEEAKALEEKPPERKGGHDYFTRMAMWLYALSTTHRQKNKDGISFEDFLDTLPFEDEELAPLILAVNIVMGWVDDPADAPKNVEPPAASASSEPAEAVEKTGESTPGDDSTTSQS